MKTLEDLVPKMIEATRVGSLIWTPGEASSIFRTALGKYSIEVWEWADPEDDTEGFSIGMKAKAESSNSAYLDVVVYDKYSPYYSIARDLHAMARRSSAGLDKVFEEIDAELTKLARP